MAGKFLGDMFVVSSEFGYRNRSNGVPDNLFLNLSGGVILFTALSLNISYYRVDTRGPASTLVTPDSLRSEMFFPN